MIADEELRLFDAVAQQVTGGSWVVIRHRGGLVEIHSLPEGEKVQDAWRESVMVARIATDAPEWERNAELLSVAPYMVRDLLKEVYRLRGRPKDHPEVEEPTYSVATGDVDRLQNLVSEIRAGEHGPGVEQACDTIQRLINTAVWTSSKNRRKHAS